MRSYEVSEYDKSLILQPSITYKIKFEVMDESMQIINVVEGVVVGGSYSINSSSDVRRSLSITVVPTYFYDTNMVLDPNGYIWLDKIIHLYIGVVDLRTQETKYYSEGYYYYTNVSGTYNTSTNTLSLSLNDFMINLNGTKNGQLAAWITSIPAYIEDEFGRPITYHIIKDAMATTLTQLSSYVKGYFIEDIGESKGLARFNTNYESYRKRHKIWNSVPYDLEFNTGDSVLNIITTLRDLYPNFETYFDPVTNDFVCQMIPSLDNDEIIIDNDFLQMVTQSENISTNLTTVRNVCEIWGEVLDCDYYADTSYTLNAYQLIVNDYQAQLNEKLDRLNPLDHQIADKMMSLEWNESEQVQKRLDDARNKLEQARSDLQDYENQLLSAQAELDEYGKNNIYYFSQYVAKWNVQDLPGSAEEEKNYLLNYISKMQSDLRQAKSNWARVSWGSYRQGEDLEEYIDDEQAYNLYNSTLNPTELLEQLTADANNKKRESDICMTELSNVVRNRDSYSSVNNYQQDYDFKLQAYLTANGKYEKARSLLYSLSSSIPYLTVQVNNARKEKDEKEKELIRIQNSRNEYYSDEAWQSAIASATSSYQSAIDSLHSYETQLEEAKQTLELANRTINHCINQIENATKQIEYIDNNRQKIEDEYRQTVRNRYQENIISPLTNTIRQQRIIINELENEYNKLYAAAGYENIQRVREEMNNLEAQRTLIEQEYWEIFERQRSRVQLLSESEQKDAYAYIAEIEHFPTEYSSGTQIAIRICETNIGRSCYLRINNLESIPVFDENTDYFIEPETFEPNSVYVFQLERHPADGLPDTVAYLLGKWQVHALDVLTDGTTDGIWLKQVPIKDNMGNLVYDNKGNITYENEIVKDKEGNAVYIYSQKYFEIKYDCENVNLTVIKDSPFTVQKLGEIVDVKTGDRFEKIRSDSVARENAIYENWKNCRLTDTITLQTLLLPFVDVNTKVSYRPQNETRIKEYIISSINHNLSSFTSSITMYRYYPLYMNNTVTTAWTTEEDNVLTWVTYDRDIDYSMRSTFDVSNYTALNQFKARYCVDNRTVSISGTVVVDLNRIFNREPNANPTVPDLIHDTLVTFNNSFALPALKLQEQCVYVDTWYSGAFISEPYVIIDPYERKMYLDLKPDTTIMDVNTGRTKSTYFNLMFNLTYSY